MQEERSGRIHVGCDTALRSASRRIVESQSFHSVQFYCASLRRMADIPVYESITSMVSGSDVVQKGVHRRFRFFTGDDVL